MRKLPLMRVRPGEILAESVVQRDGQVLLCEGTTLSPNHLQMLRQRGVQLVTVGDPHDTDLEGETEANPIEVDPERLKEIVLAQSRWFGDVRSNPVMAEVFRCVVNSLARGEHR